MQSVPTSTSPQSISSPYSHLDTQKGQIRLAVLAPGSYDDVLVIRLQTDNLFEIIAPDYEALSYVWGQDLSTQKALVNDIAVTITANLDCALRHLRYQYKHRTLWIDALCINQADALERNAQVQLMNRIYPSASMVVIWLGPADRDDVEAIEKIKASRPPSSTSLLRICERPWFYRVWVAQELALAHSDPVVYLGLSHLSWTTLHDLITKLCENRTSLLLEDETRRPMKLSHRLKVALWNAKALGEVRQTRSTATLFQNLCNTQRSLATDHRDKVYGVLGLSNWSNPVRTIKPDYRKTAAEVFTETTFRHIQDLPVSVYERFPLHPPPQQPNTTFSGILDLPSWAVDLSISPRSPDKVPFYNRLYVCDHHCQQEVMLNARQNKFSSIVRLGQNNTLHTVGTSFGTVVETSKEHFVPETSSYSEDAFVHIHRIMLKPRNMSIERLIEDAISSGKYGESTKREMRVALKKFSKVAVDPDTVLAKRDLQRLERVIKHRILFVTGEGHMGLSCHPDTVNGIRPGDMLVGLFGVNLPFILRRSESGESFRIVNVAFVAGHACCSSALLDTPEEITEEDIWDNPERFGLQKFAIV